MIMATAYDATKTKAVSCQYACFCVPEIDRHCRSFVERPSCSKTSELDNFLLSKPDVGTSNEKERTCSHRTRMRIKSYHLPRRYQLCVLTLNATCCTQCEMFTFSSAGPLIWNRSIFSRIGPSIVGCGLCRRRFYSISFMQWGCAG